MQGVVAPCLAFDKLGAHACSHVLVSSIGSEILFRYWSPIKLREQFCSMVVTDTEKCSKQPENIRIQLPLLEEPYHPTVFDYRP
eukprot:5403521-Amphidinium_carterae.1